MAYKATYFPGMHCKNAGISIEGLMDGTVLKLSCKDFTKGILCELNQYRKANNVPWQEFYCWMQMLTDETVPNLATLKVTLTRLEKTCVKLRKEKQRSKLEKLLNQTAPITSKELSADDASRYSAADQVPTCSYETEALKKAYKELTGELHETEAALSNEKLKVEELSTKLSKLSIRNINKKIKRRDDKLKDSQCCIDDLKKQVAAKSAAVIKIEKRLHSAHLGKECYRSKLNRCLKGFSESGVAIEEVTDQLATLEEKYQLKINELEVEIDELRNELGAVRLDENDMESKARDCTIETEVHSQLYLDNVRQCCLELLSMNVGIRQVEPVIRSVIRNIANKETDKLPKPSTLVRMLTELKCLSYQQIADQLQGCENVTLHADGTSKFGQHYGSFQLSTDSTAYSLGLSEMLTGSAQQTLDLFKQILRDFEHTVGSQAKNKLLSSIKNTMSDRHIVQKNFNCLLEDYRASVLPEVISSWKDLSTEEQSSMSYLNNFFCGLHLLVGMADAAASVLLQWEAAHFSENPTTKSVLIRKSECGIIRLVRTTCKALSKHGSEQSGVYQSFTAYLRSNHIQKNPLASFRGNRFNILFYDAGAVYYISTLIKKFFTEVWQTPNQLLRAVLADVQVLEYVAGCKALGLVNKIVTGPLWRVLECQETTILSMNEKFTRLKNCLEQWSEDANTVLSGEALLYSDFPPTKDCIFESLVAPSVYDATAQEILEVLFNAFSSLISRLVADHLPDGKYHNPSAVLTAEVKSVPTTNAISERDFAKLDRFLREKPNASTLSLEAMIMFTNNKTAAWLSAKTSKEREELMKKARSLSPEFKQLYNIRRQKLLEERAKLLRAKRLQLERLQAKKVKEKEELVQGILRCGLWQSKQKIEEGLAKLKTKKEKVAALKLQLDFRKKVLEQKHIDKTLFFLTKNKRQLTIVEISENLCQLLDCTARSILEGSDAIVKNCESLIGKQIYHKWKDVDGEEKWYKGQVLGLVPGTSEWYNVQYDGENEILSLNLLVDIDKGDLEILN